MIERLLARLERPTDPAGLAVFRILFGALMVFSTARYAWRGWIDEILVAPDFHFTYAGFEWVAPPPGAWPYVQFGVMGLAALCVCLGVKARASALVFFALFTWAELAEKAAYLNHYYLVSLLALLLALVRTDGALALWPERAPARTTQWHYTLFRAQLACVYGFAGFAKLNADWLLRGEPLYTWMQAYAHWPLVGEWMGTRGAALAMSWGGAVFDLFVWLALWWPRTRRWAYAVAIVFHVTVWMMFPIGVFPWVMLASATVFFAPSWPRRWMRDASPPRPAARSRAALALAALWIALQVAIPLRFALYPGHVNWTERGFRFAWRVMLVEKTGQVEYRVVSADGARAWRVYPRGELTRLQYRMLCTQPDMISEYARELARRWKAEGERDVRVYADAFVAFNGRPSRRLVDPEVDLARSHAWDGQPWVLEMDDVRSE